MNQTDHTLKAFDEDLDELRATISQMGGMAEHSIREAMKALMNRDHELAASVVEDVKRIKAHPLVPPYIPVYGYIYDCKTGQLVEVAEATAAGRAA